MFAKGLGRGGTDGRQMTREKNIDVEWKSVGEFQCREGLRVFKVKVKDFGVNLRNALHLNEVKSQ